MVAENAVGVVEGVVDEVGDGVGAGREVEIGVACKVGDKARDGAIIGNEAMGGDGELITGGGMDEP